MRIAENVEMIELGSMNPILTWDASHLVLIDAGFPGQTDLFVKAIEDCGFKASDLTEIILTHQDIDHVGCVADLLKLAPAAKVIAHPVEVPYIDGTKTPIKLAQLENSSAPLTDQQKEWRQKLRAGFAQTKVNVGQKVEDQEVLPYCGGIEIVFTPGHTPGHIALYLKESRILVTGDALNFTGTKITGSNPVYTDDMAEAQRSLQKMKAINPKGYASYHSGFLRV